MLRRSGSMLMEVSVATVLLAMALTGVAQLLIAAGRQQRSLEWRRLAALEASNLLEIAIAQDYDDLTNDSLSSPAPSDDFQQAVPTGTASLEVESADDELRLKRVTVRVTWRNFAGLDEQVELMAWKFAPSPETAAP